MRAMMLALPIFGPFALILMGGGVTDSVPALGVAEGGSGIWPAAAAGALDSMLDWDAP